MKPGDLVQVNAPCNSEVKAFRGGEVGLIISHAIPMSGPIRNELVNVLFPEGTVEFATHLLDLISDPVEIL